jgi:hypothetical protein
MNREQAQECLHNGCKLTHTHFTKKEWVKGVGNGMLRFEDGIECHSDTFWMGRSCDSFDKGWHVAPK